MKQLVMSLALVAIPFWFPEGDPVYAELVGAPAPVTTEPVVVMVSAEALDGAGRGWLGVSIGEVPEPLAAHLETEGKGILILDVFKDSPAERAGLAADDIILSVDGATVDGDVARATELIRSRKPGERVELQIIHEGQRKSFRVEIGTRPESLPMEWKARVGPPVEEHIRKRGRLAVPGPGGKWLIKDLGGSELSTEVHRDGDRKIIKTQVDRDGSKVIITQEDDEEIVVRRIDKDGNESTGTYENEEELKAADAEAFELFAKVGQGHGFHLGFDFLGKHGDVIVDLDDFNVDLGDLNVELEDLKTNMGDWQGTLGEQLREAQEAFKNARQELHEAYREMAEQMRTQVKPRDGRSEPGGQWWNFQHDAPGLIVGRLGKPTHSFKVLGDGKIEVRSRKGDSEVVRTFQSEADLARQDPKLYEKYESATESEE